MKISTIVMTPFMMNGYVLEDEGEVLVLDPGDDPPELRQAIAGLNVKLICNTHCHIDHCAGNGPMVELTGAPLACHKEDLVLLHALQEQAMMFGVDSAVSPDPSQYLEEGDTISIGSTELQVLHTPGHAPGHIVLVGDGFVFVGDVLFAGSIGRSDLPGGNHQQLITSIREKLLPLPDETVVYSGHGPTTTIGAERRSNPFLV